MAGLRVLVAVAQADGVLAPEERSALEGSLSGLELGTTVDALFAEKVDLKGALAQIKSTDARQQTYESAVAMASADGTTDANERKVLEEIRNAFGLAEKKDLLARFGAEAKDTILPSNIAPISDPAMREKEIKEDMLKYSVFAGMLGVFPIPGIALATDLAAIGLQVKMIRDIGQYYGFKVGAEAAKSLMTGFVGSTGVRIAVNNLAKFVPGWGSALGALSNFAATWAIGRVADEYFASGMKLEGAVLKEAYKKALVDGKKLFGMHKDSVMTKKAESDKTMESLNADLSAGKLTQEEYNRKVSELMK
ncbi:MAG: TerB family tellurite resistance protein [Deltaproteobacteria bacterium]|nr:TerB family tellurite resistance protein [Deltaproteobacteria bacterium]